MDKICRNSLFPLIFGWTFLSLVTSECIRSPVDETRADRTEGNNGFHLEIQTNPRNDSFPEPDGYVPGEFYTVVLRGYRTQYTVQTFRGFTIVAVLADDSKAFNEGVGQFQLDEQGPARRSTLCWHAVTQTSLYPKTEVALTWRAPSTNVGCIEFRAMVLEYRDIWYMDDGPLTKKLCQIIGYEKMVPNDQANECCACDEAKYELTFDGLWSRQTHPKDFPSLEHLTHFSDIIGASHSRKFTMWAFDNYATDGLKELAEWGNTYQMEQELKTHSKEIRTIIKARGLWFPNVQGIAKSIFRVDKYHHLVSLASMLGPSPDWLVGISSINLCLPDCTWTGERTFDLFPFDAGTDSGVSYMAPNNPTLPRERIKAITTKDPNDPRAPFYDRNRDQMPPLAKLTLKREKVYPMECKNITAYQSEKIEGTSEDLEYNNRRECMIGGWTPWSLCSATCGKGIRMRSRVYKFPVKAQMFNCERQMIKKEFCNAPISVCEDSEAFNDNCATTSWGQWTDCSVTCGTGIRARTRNFHNPAVASENRCTVDLADNEQCIEICKEPKEEGQCEGGFPRYFYDSLRKSCRRFIYTGCKGNRNNFQTEDQCLQTCSDKKNETKMGYVPANHLANALGVDSENVNDGGEPVDCMVSEWSPWSECSRTCGRGRRQRTRFIKVYPRNNGRACPTSASLIQRRRCLHQRFCPREYQCRATAWTQWSACSATCGKGMQTRRRQVLRPRTGNRNARFRGCNIRTSDRKECLMQECR